MSWLREALAQACLQHGAPGGAVGVIHDSSRIEASFGVRCCEGSAPIDSRTVFRIGSMTKMLTALMLAREVDAGVLGFDAKVSHWAPDLVLVDDAARADLTLAHLLTHTGGLFGDVLDGPAVGDCALSAYVEAGARLRQVTPPGQAFSYANAGFAIVGRIAEHVRKQNWFDLFDATWRQRMGLERTASVWTEVAGDNIAIGHAWDGAGGVAPLAEAAERTAMGPAGFSPGSCTQDILELAEKVLAGDVVGRSVLTHMCRPHVISPVPSFAASWGLGVQLFSEAPLVFGHDGAVNGQSSFLRIGAEPKQVLVLLVNGGDGRAIFEHVKTVAQAQLGLQLGPASPRWPAQQDDAMIADYVGRYGVGLQQAEVSADTGALIAEAISVDEKGKVLKPTLYELRRAGPDHLFVSRTQGQALCSHQRFRFFNGERGFWFRGRLLPEMKEISA
ncbi:MAG: beta-lactamase family protein [Alphaproteobacteria bacterium]|nr:beta-lactamase family protein [Alphaproteobacteria bacterium]